MLKALQLKGFATASEKAEVKVLVKELESEDAEVVSEEISAVADLPETDPADEVEVEEAVAKAFNKTSKKLEESLSKKLDSSISEMKSEVETWVKAQKDLAKAGAGSQEEKIAEKHAKYNTFLKGFTNAILSGDDTKAKEMTTDATGSPFAGYAVDTELSAEIRHLTTVFGVARREFFATPLSKNAYEANALATDVTVGWVAEAAVIPSTQIVLAQQELKLKKLAAIVTLTRELIEDEEIDLFSFIATRVAEGFAKAEDKAFFMGTGSSDTANGGFTGITANAGVPVVNLTGALSTITIDKIYEMQDVLPEGAHANAKYYGNRTIKTIVRLLKDGDGRFIYNDPINNSGFATLAGKPFVSVEAMTAASDVATTDGVCLLLADLKKSSILGFKNGLVADRFNAGTVRNVDADADINLITTDREAVRFVSRVGAITILPTAAVVLATVEA